MPVPLSEAVSELPEETTVSVPLSAPSAAGVKTTLIWQLVPGATLEQLFEVTLKLPVVVAEETCAAKLELLVHVKLCGGVVKLYASLPKFAEVGASVGCPPSSVSSN